MSTFGENLDRQLDRAGINQEVLAKRLGTSASQISEWKNGVKLPQVPNILRIATVLGCTVDALVQGINQDYDEARRRTEATDARRLATSGELRPLKPDEQQVVDAFRAMDLPMRHVRLREAALLLEEVQRGETAEQDDDGDGTD